MDLVFAPSQIETWPIDRLRPYVNRPGFTGGQNSRRIARYGTDIKEENREAVFA
jgi:hypothetical protein